MKNQHKEFIIVYLLILSTLLLYLLICIYFEEAINLNFLCICQLVISSMLLKVKFIESKKNILYRSLVLIHLNLNNIPITVFMLSVQLPQYSLPIEKRLSRGRIHSFLLFRATRFITLTYIMLYHHCYYYIVLEPEIKFFYSILFFYSNLVTPYIIKCSETRYT
jgi:hypothetical protein